MTTKTSGPRLKPVTAPRLLAMKGKERITMVTAYDATFSRMLDEAGVEMLLVGDSLGMVVQGKDSTLSVTLDEMIYHCRAVARGAKRAHVVGDMPFMSYHVSPEEAVRNAGRLVAEGGAHSVKLEGGVAVAPVVRRIVDAGIPVVGHVGLTPQSMHAMGGFRVQGKTDEAAERILSDAHALVEAGAFCIVLEGIPKALAERITAEIPVPTIGIGAGVHCDGQVLVCYDLLGLTQDLKPKFVKQYGDLFASGKQAAETYCAEVKAGTFPEDAHSFGVKKAKQQKTEAKREPTLRVLEAKTEPSPEGPDSSPGGDTPKRAYGPTG